jgi:LPXTG-site transpeptidase (sortase) family protein
VTAGSTLERTASDATPGVTPGATTSEVAAARARSLPVDVIVQVPQPDEIKDRGRHRWGRDEAPVKARRRDGIISVVAGVLVVVALIGAVLVIRDLDAAPAAAVDRAQAGLRADLQRTWTSPGPDPAVVRDETPMSVLPGDAPPASASARLAVPAVTPVFSLAVPRLGREWAVGRGVTPSVLAGSPGLYPGMTPVGAPGNTAVAARNMPSLFAGIEGLAPGDLVQVRTRAHELSYRVVSSEVVLPTDLSVLDQRPVDRQPPNSSMLTLTTTTQVYGEDRRFVVYARLADDRPR